LAQFSIALNSCKNCKTVTICYELTVSEAGDIPFAEMSTLPIDTTDVLANLFQTHDYYAPILRVLVERHIS